MSPVRNGAELWSRHAPQSLDDDPDSNQHGRGTEGPSKRRRATTACALCRKRKAKCDNARPQCGFCKTNKANCQYEEDAEPSRFDPASEEILDQISELKRLLTDKTHTLPVLEPSIRSQSSHRDQGSDGPGQAMPSVDDHDSLRKATQRSIPPQHGRASPESLLRWPIFSEVFPENVRAIQSFLFDGLSLVLGSVDNGTSLSTATGMRAGAARQSVNEEHMVALTSKFLQLIHPRNPILDPEVLRRVARQVAEHGLTWDPSSCLLLIVCAIADLTVPWATAEYFEHPNDQPWSPDIVFREKSSAEAYFHAARKRLGLLDHSVTSIQCLFFASVYEKHAMRPIEAHHYVQQGLERLRVRRCYTSDTISDDDRSFDERLLGSLLKAEGELQPEVGFPRSCYQNEELSESLPAPPAQHPSGALRDDADVDLEQRGWYFYLAEISLRRRIEDSMALMYEHTESHWIRFPGNLISRYDECNTQVNLWHSFLHPSVQFSETQFPDNELSFYLQGRFYQWRTLLLRPFLYCVLNTPADHQHPKTKTLATEHIQRCGQYINHLSYHGRHGGTWFTCRATFACALSILAGVLSNEESLCFPNWRHSISLALRTLKRWAPEAQDVEAMRVLLDGAFHETMKRQDAD